MNSRISRKFGAERRRREKEAEQEEVAKLTQQLEGKIPKSSRVKHQITASEYISLMKKQLWRCVICQKEFVRQPPDDRYDSTIDHDHESGKIRGLLCRQCNAMLGNAKDNPTILANGIQYLFKHINSPDQSARFGRPFVDLLQALRNRIALKKGIR